MLSCSRRFSCDIRRSRINDSAERQAPRKIDWNCAPDSAARYYTAKAASTKGQNQARLFYVAAGFSRDIQRSRIQDSAERQAPRKIDWNCAPDSAARYYANKFASTKPQVYCRRTLALALRRRRNYENEKVIGTR